MALRSSIRDRSWLEAVLKNAFGKGFLGFFGFAVFSGILCYQIKGPDAFYHAISRDSSMVYDLMPRVVVAVSIAALIWVMLPRDRISRLVGHEAGLSGLIIATFAGIITPGGPSAAYALLGVLGASGAERGALVAYITSWALLGLQRVMLWDVPFMGAEFALLRLLVCLPLPIIAGLIARRLPFAMILREEPHHEVKKA